MVRPVRIAAVSYLNTKPLVFGLAERLPKLKLYLICRVVWLTTCLAVS